LLLNIRHPPSPYFSRIRGRRFSQTRPRLTTSNMLYPENHTTNSNQQTNKHDGILRPFSKRHSNHQEIQINSPTLQTCLGAGVSSEKCELGSSATTNPVPTQRIHPCRPAGSFRCRHFKTSAIIPKSNIPLTLPNPLACRQFHNTTPTHNNQRNANRQRPTRRQVWESPVQGNFQSGKAASHGTGAQA
jgi:hypothetical protein